ncbi:MAG: TRC40/GET3/ArsA family transport-energizing ATPase, partial [Planctomycetota bacterium]
MKSFLDRVPRFLFFTGKGGVGKTSMASCTAVGLAERGRSVLLISTDPASNLDQVFDQPLTSVPTPVDGVPGLAAMNINPLQAAAEYRERMVGPYRGVLPASAVEQMEEQLSGACTVEIAGFNEFSKFIGDEDSNRDFDHVILDTAPTGHTLRLLSLPAAWNDFIAENETGSSCLGPVSGLADQKVLFEKVVEALCRPEETALVLVARAEAMSLAEAARASEELRRIGMTHQELIVNGVFTGKGDDAVAQAFARQATVALEGMPEGLSSLPRLQIPFRPSGVMGIDAMRQVVGGDADAPSPVGVEGLEREVDAVTANMADWDRFIDGLEENPGGVIMTMGKGGVGKTTLAARIATDLARRGHSVLLSTTDPAAHVDQVADASLAGLHLDRIDPEVERTRYVESVLETSRVRMAAEDLALLEEELASP